MPFIAENKLEEALMRAVLNPAAIAEFYRLLLDSDLLVLGTIEGQEDNAKPMLQAAGKLSLVTGENNGRPFLPVFSSRLRMQAYIKEESRYLTVNGRDLFETTRGAPIVLSPGSEYGKALSPEEVWQLIAPQLLPRHASTAPAGVEDQRLIQALTGLFESRPDIQTGWIIQITFADGVPHPLVGVETSGDMAGLMSEIQRIAMHELSGTVFDVQRVERDNPTGMAEALLQAKPFYRRGAPAAPRILN